MNKSQLSEQIVTLCEEYYANWESYDLLPEKIMEVVSKQLSTQQTECEQKVAEAVRAERERIKEYVEMTLALLGINHGPAKMIGSWINKEDLLEVITNTEEEA